MIFRAILIVQKTWAIFQDFNLWSFYLDTCSTPINTWHLHPRGLIHLLLCGILFSLPCLPLQSLVFFEWISMNCDCCTSWMCISVLRTANVSPLIHNFGSDKVILPSARCAITKLLHILDPPLMIPTKLRFAIWLNLVVSYGTKSSQLNLSNTIVILSSLGLHNIFKNLLSWQYICSKGIAENRIKCF